ncbi:cysteine desulfurase family protein [Xylanimonas sp. McL0601]|uniref:cysteine desulfurase family protein n=1 Tax=Xylanimonas sp. McL0601 TaxID=3414739 RepID=UPI003CEF6953
MLYADAAATTPVRREVLEAMWPYLTGEFGNPSSTHELGHRASTALADARAAVAAAFGARPGEVVFTAGGTEADNLAIKGLALARPRGRHVVTTAIEHEAVLESVAYLERFHGFEVTVLAPSPDGVVAPDALRSALRPDTTLVTIHHANNEIGTVQDVAALADVAHEVGALFHTDAVQAAGWLDVSLRGLGVDAISVSGHKLGAPKGVGALLLRAGLPLEPLIHGGGQERGRRSGTENVAFAVGLAAAVRTLPGLRARADDVAASRDALIDGVLARVPAAILTGAAPARRLPGHASFCFSGTSGEAVLLELERSGVLTSSGSACAAGRDEPSHVLLALGLSPEVAQTSVRFTLEAPFEAAPLVEAVVAATTTVGRLGA